MHKLVFKASELKAAPDKGEGVILGRASVYGTLDSYNDVVMPGAFTKTLQENGGQIVVLSQHDPSKAIGKAVLSDEADGLHAEIHLLMELPDAQAEYARVKAGLVSGISIGYQTIRDDYDKNGIRKLLELRLWEISLVTFPANQFARVTAVKRRRKQVGDYVDPELAARLSALDAFIDQADTLVDAILADLGIPDDDGDDADDMGAASAAAFAAKAREALKELKAGRMISAANLTKLTAARDAMNAALDPLNELITAASPDPDGKTANNAATATSTPDAGKTAADAPDSLHALAELMSGMKNAAVQMTATR